MKKYWTTIGAICLCLLSFSFADVSNDHTIYVSNSEQLVETIQSTKVGDMTVILEKGVYEVPRTLWLTGDNLTYKSQSGNRDDVILTGNYKIGNLFSVAGDNFTVQDITIGAVNNHGVQVHGELDADNATIDNVRFYDIKEQMIKGSAKTQDPNSPYSDNGIVRNCLFEFTSGEALQYYTGGIDVHRGRNWTVENNLFKNIRRASGSLTEGAIHFWSNSEGTNITGNTIINCDRGIMLGFDSTKHLGGSVANNFVHVTRDVGIYLCNAENAKVYNNTIFVDSSYGNSIEYRFNTVGTAIINTLTNKSITSRNGGTANLMNNVTAADSSWFVNPSSGDLHLSQHITQIIDKGATLPSITRDIDGDPRLVNTYDIGADEVTALNNKAIKSIALTSNYLQIAADGSTSATFTVTAKYDDGTSTTLTPDTIHYNHHNTDSILLGQSFSTYEAGTYVFYAEVNGIVSNRAVIEATAVNTETYLPTSLTVSHRDGQSFITWTEAHPLLNLSDAKVVDFYDNYHSNPKEIVYHVYKDTQPITEVTALTPIADVHPGSVYNLGLYNLTPTMQTYQAQKYYDKPLHRFVIAPGAAPLAPNQGLYVSQSDSNGDYYYAVTVTVDGVTMNQCTSDNTTTTPISESVASNTPILQFTEIDTFNYVKDATLNFYVRWENSDDSSIVGRPMNYLVAVPPNTPEKAPVGIHLHCWGGTLFTGYGWWNNGEQGAILLAANQSPYDWWTGYYDQYYDANKPKTPEEWANTVVHPYTSDRMVSFLEWMNQSEDYSIDMTRSFVAGTSMGGSGSLMMAIRYPEYFAWARSWVGVHIPEMSPNFKSSYQLVYGKPEDGVRFEDGTPVWDYYNDVWYLKNHPQDDIGFLTFCNGKNDSAIGWEQAVMFVDALQETKQPHLFVWGQNGHSQRSIMPYTMTGRTMPLDIRLDAAIPAFTDCSLDDIIGNGNPEDGDAEGQINAYLYWDTENITDTAERFEMTVALVEKAPETQCTVSITPRRLQHFQVKAGETVTYKNVDITTGTIITSGYVTADANGLITLEKQTVNKGKNRILIEK
ncbi:MAG: prolyl oligopeptidase family serine peptidase [Clostridia bacterium]|nr:prolyl oligopeptidase family serine peptidase [Clostridia bacterium]